MLVVEGSPISRECLTRPERDLFLYWKVILGYDWAQNEWHEHLHTLSQFLRNYFTGILQSVSSYNTLLHFSDFGTCTREAVSHRVHNNKYINTIAASRGGNLLRPAAAGDATLRLLTTAVVDAIADAWRPKQGTNAEPWC